MEGYISRDPHPLDPARPWVVNDEEAIAVTYETLNLALRRCHSAFPRVTAWWLEIDDAHTMTMLQEATRGRAER